MAKILIIRFSAIGDVAMTIPVIYSLAEQYPDLEITVLSRETMAPLFKEMPGNVRFYGADLKVKHRGWSGLNALYRELKPLGFDGVADFHDVLRSKYLSLRFRLGGVKTVRIRKGKKGKRRLVCKKNKVMKQQPSSFSNYAAVLERLGYPVNLNFVSIFNDGKDYFKEISKVVGVEAKREKWIGIAPFAKHKGKIYPQAKIEKVVEHFSRRKDVKLFLFGGGAEEYRVFRKWIRDYPNIVSTIGVLNMHTELILISYLDVMISMDSANMHFASLVDTPVVSIWGATHPYCGFMGWRQQQENAVQVDMPCRPCSVFGDKPCYWGDYECMKAISPEMIIERVERVIEE